MKILFVGPNASEYAQMTGHGDVAAARWAYGLLKGLQNLGHEILVLSHTHERIWPRGERFWRSRDERYYPSDWPCVDVPYPAVFKLREHWLNWMYPRKAQEIVRSQEFDAVLLYNCMEPYQVSVQSVAHREGIPVFPIILDGDDPRKDSWAKLLKDTQESTGVVFLSHWAKENYPAKKPVFHLDGGVGNWNGRPSKGPPVGDQRVRNFVHTGALDYWRGLDFFERVARIVDERKLPVKLVLCGRLADSARDRLRKIPCVDLKGFASDSELDSICGSATGFLNVREPSVGDNILNYPSKLPHYLSYGKPVVSTWIDSLAPEYRTLLFAENTNTPEGFVAELNRVVQIKPSELKRRYDLILRWFEDTRLWSKQAQRLAEWMGQIIHV